MDFAHRMLPLIAVLMSLGLSKTEAYRKKFRELKDPNSETAFYRRSFDSKDICACYSQGEGQYLVREKLIAQGQQNIRRVVVYFYVDTDNNAITTYIPDTSKQNQFPDFTLSEEDILKNYPENTLYDVILNYYKLEVQTLEPITENNQIEIVVDSEPVKDETPVVEIPAVEDVVVEKPIIEIPAVEIPVGEEPVVETPVDETPVIEIPAIETPVVETETTLVPSSESDFSTTETLVVSENPAPSKPLALKPIPMVTHSTYQTSTVSASPHYYFETVSLAPDTYPDNSFYSQNKIIYNYATFESWYQKQVAQFGLSQYEKLLYLNNKEFKDALKYTLSRNGIILSSDGFLRGLDGKNIDTNKLELRCIWIGQRLNIKKLISNQFTYLGKDPILQTILVSLVYPPRILGIIPIGKTDFSSKFKSLNSTVQSLKAKSISESKNIGRVVSPIESIVVWKSTPSVQSSQAVSKISPAYSKSISSASSSATASEYYENSSASERRTDTEVMKPLHHLLKVKETEVKDSNESKQDDESSSGDDISHRQDAWRKLKNRSEVLKSLIELLQSQERSDSGSDVEEDEEDVAPGVRIIGGKAAVSSGSLINNRGRSSYRG